MQIKNKMDADLIRRLKLYGFGVLLGLILVNAILKKRGCNTPGETKLHELASQQLVYTTHGACRMKCRNITEEEVKYILKTGNINYNKSKVRDTPCGTYAVEGITKDNQKVRIIIADCELTSKLVTAIDLNNESDAGCDCK